MSLIKKAYKMIIAVCLIFSLLLLTGCSDFDMSADEFISPPKAGGELYQIEQALKNSVTTAYTLKYPTAGEHRSAYILADLTGRGQKNFAMAFYSSINAENVTTMHLNLMKKVDASWISISDVSVAAVGIEKVELCDLDGDGVDEITVGWNIYAGLDKKVVAYRLSGAKLIPLMQEPYKSFLCCDLSGDGRKEIFVLNHDTDNALAKAKYFAFEGEKVSKISTCDIDGAVASFNEPVFGALTTGTPAIYVDAAKGTGMQTEILFIKDGELTSPMYLALASAAASPTYRNNTVVCSDINSDGYLDIPLIDPINNFNPQTDETLLVPTTRWCSYNGSTLTTTTLAVMDYTDGYYFELPPKWQQSTNVLMSVENRQRTVVLWNTETAEVISELVRVRTVSEAEWDIADNGYNGYYELARADGEVYAAMFSAYVGPEAITKDQFQKLFHLIG